MCHEFYLILSCSSSNSTIVPLFEKVLSASDAGRIGRLVLPKACAEVSSVIKSGIIVFRTNRETLALSVSLSLATKRLGQLTVAGIFSTNLSAGGPSSEDSGCEGKRMGIPVPVLAK